MKRGEVWTAAAARTYVAKPRPVVIVQDDQFDSTGSLTVLPVTTEMVDASFFRLPVQPAEANGLRAPSHLMVDKITTVPKHRLGRRVGVLSAGDMRRLNRAMLVFLGLV